MGDEQEGNGVAMQRGFRHWQYRKCVRDGWKALRASPPESVGGLYGSCRCGLAAHRPKLLPLRERLPAFISLDDRPLLTSVASTALW
jgi:hypothetical protein